MIVSPIILLQGAAMLASAVSASPVLKSWNSSHAYSVPGTLDANRYDIDIATEAVHKAAHNIGEIINDIHHSESNASIVDVVVSSTPANPSTPFNVSDGASVMKRVPILPFRNCRLGRCPGFGRFPPKSKNFNHSDSMKRTSPFYDSHILSDVFDENVTYPSHDSIGSIAAGRVIPPYMLHPSTVASKPNASASSALERRAIPTAIHDYVIWVPAQSSDENATSATNEIDKIVLDSVRDEINYMIDGILEASWGVKGNLLDAGDLVTLEEVKELSRNAAHIIETSRAAVRTVLRVGNVANVNVHQEMSAELVSLANALKELWTPINEYIIKIGSINGINRDVSLEQLERQAMHASYVVSEIIARLTPGES